MSVLAFLLACDGAEPTPPQVAESEVHVAIDRTQLLELSQRWVVGDDADSGAQFYIVWQAARHADGDFLVVDAGNDRIAVLGHDGQLTRSIGRSGQGPGEFGRPNGLVVRGDSVLVGDQGNRVHFFSIDGSHLDTYVLNFDDPEVNRLGSVARDSIGWLVSAAGYFREGTERPPAQREYLHRLDPGNGAVTETGLRWHHEGEGVWSGGFWVDAAFAHRPSAAYDASGRFLVNDSPSYEIRVLSIVGDLELRVLGDAPPVPITSALLSEWEAWRACELGTPECDDSRTRLALTLENPDRIQPIDRIRTFNSGYFAVRRNDLDEDRFDGESIAQYDYFSPDGDFVGSTDGLTPLWFDGAELLARETDEFDVERIALYDVG